MRRSRFRRPSHATIVAYLGLFVALGGTAYAVNTVRSSDIVDGEVKSVDVGNNEILSADVKDQSLTTFDVSTFLGADVVDNTLTGDDVDESTLGRVPDASALSGHPVTDFRTGTKSANQQTDQCAVTGQYRLCAPVTITVPATDTYRVDVSSSMTALGSIAGTGLYCAASGGPTCLSAGVAAGFSLTPNQYTNVSRTGTALVGPGTHTFGMAARFDVGIGVLNSANTTTTVRWRSYFGEF